VNAPVRTSRKRICVAPARVDAKAIRFPSGLHAGSTSVWPLPDPDTGAGAPPAVAGAMNRFARPFTVETSAMRSRADDQVGFVSMLPPKPNVAAVSRAGFASGVGATYTRGAPLASLTYASAAPPAANAGWLSLAVVVVSRCSAPPAT